MKKKEWEKFTLNNDLMIPLGVLHYSIWCCVVTIKFYIYVIDSIDCISIYLLILIDSDVINIYYVLSNAIIRVYILYLLFCDKSNMLSYSPILQQIANATLFH